VCLKFRESVLGDHVLFPRRLSVRMSRCDFRSEDILFKEALFYKLLQVLPEGPAVDCLVFISFLGGEVLL